jgi:hypothetical protein
MEKSLLLNTDWRISADADNWILQKRRVVQDEESKNFGQESWVDWAYCSSLERVFTSACEHVARDKWPQITEITKEINSIRALINKFMTL